jgi:hypothetical protein
MARRQLLTDEERRLLLGVPHDPDALARHYTFNATGPPHQCAPTDIDCCGGGLCVTAWMEMTS